jgi:hypothetical protein
MTDSIDKAFDRIVFDKSSNNEDNDREDNKDNTTTNISKVENRLSSFGIGKTTPWNHFDPTTFNILPIEEYLRNINQRNSNIIYDYRILSGDGLIIFNVDREKFTTPESILRSRKIVYEGYIHKTNTRDLFFVDFPQRKVRVMINFFM